MVDKKNDPGIWQKTVEQREQGSRPALTGKERQGEAGTDILAIS